MIQAAIQILINNTAFKNAIGLNAAGTKYKVYPVVADKAEEPPYAVLFLTAQAPESKCTDEATFDIVFCSKPTTTGAYLKNYTLAALARTALLAHSGAEAGSGITVSFDIVNQRDGYDSAQDLMQRICTYRASVGI